MLFGLDFSGLGVLGVVTKVFSQPEIVSMASGSLSSVFDSNQLNSLVSLILSKYSVVQGADKSDSVPAKEIESNMKVWVPSAATGVAAKIVKEKIFGPMSGVFRVDSETGASKEMTATEYALKSSFEDLANDWSSKGISIVYGQAATTTSGQSAASSSASVSSPSRSASNVATPSAPRRGQTSVIRTKVVRQMSKSEKNRLMWIVGAGGFVFLAVIGIIASRE